MGTKKKAQYVRSRVRVVLTPGAAVRVARDAQEMSQSDLAAATGISQPTLSAIEGGRVPLGAARAERLARALRVHPAVLLWPNWQIESEARATGTGA